MAMAVSGALLYDACSERRPSMTTNDHDEIELSEHSSEVTQDGITVQVGIYRPAGSQDGWTLEVVDEDDNSLIWEDTFESDLDAWNEFERALSEEGIEQLVGSAVDDDEDDDDEEEDDK